MIDLSSEDAFTGEVVFQSGEGLTVAYFTAPWCGPCRMLKPVLEQLEAENPPVAGKAEGIRVVRIDVDQFPEIAREFSLMSVPTLVFFLYGQPVFTQNGMTQKAKLQEIIDRYQYIV